MYDTFKKDKRNEIYTGMKIGNSHLWNYDGGQWYEVKVAPDRWKIKFDCVKSRFNTAPTYSGANINTKYHWYIIADQLATKLDSNSYMTTMNGIKFKIGHKRPNWKHFSYEYPEQKSYKERVIEILEHILKKLKEQE